MCLVSMNVARNCREATCLERKERGGLVSELCRIPNFGYKCDQRPLAPQWFQKRGEDMVTLSPYFVTIEWRKYADRG